MLHESRWTKSELYSTETNTCWVEIIFISIILLNLISILFTKMVKLYRSLSVPSFMWRSKGFYSSNILRWFSGHLSSLVTTDGLITQCSRIPWLLLQSQAWVLSQGSVDRVILLRCPVHPSFLGLSLFLYSTRENNRWWPQ